ncbi:MAG TPA: hypothetical protein PKM94_13945, partial [candidate division Zixibacteria bacterium]|nr:hypothetical protein [candidate division Zixibacteria bacterium]
MWKRLIVLSAGLLIGVPWSGCGSGPEESADVGPEPPSRVVGMLQGGLTWPASISVWFEHPDPASIDSFLIYRKIGDGSFAPVKVKTLQPAAGTGNPKGGEPGDVP